MASAILFEMRLHSEMLINECGVYLMSRVATRQVDTLVLPHIGTRPGAWCPLTNNRGYVRGAHAI